jgi:hypothetical protein
VPSADTVAAHLRGGISFYECLQQEDGHFPGRTVGLLPAYTKTLPTKTLPTKTLTTKKPCPDTITHCASIAGCLLPTKSGSCPGIKSAGCCIFSLHPVTTPSAPKPCRLHHHRAGDYGGPMFLMPGLIIALYTCGVLDKV